MKGRTYQRGTPEERFNARVQRGPGCWEYQGYRRKGYGKFGVSSSKSVLAHRFAYELWVGPIPAGVAVHHLCGNPPCVRPDHLSLVKPGEHSAHHVRERGYVDNQHGERWPLLTREQILEKERLAMRERRRKAGYIPAVDFLERGKPVLVLIRWNGRGPRNVLIEREDGSRVVRPFRGLRRAA